MGTKPKAVLITIAYSAVATAVVYKISALITSGGRIEENLELEGMDIGYHGEQHLVVDETHVVASIKAKKSKNTLSLAQKKPHF